MEGYPESDSIRGVVMDHSADSFATLRAELVRRGYFHKATGHILVQFAVLQAMAIGG